jgi:hypothetical protein
MKGLPVILLFVVIAIISGCISETDMSVTNILMLSEFYNITYYTEIEDEYIGDDQTVIFYIETRDFKTKKTREGYELYLSMDIEISDEWNNTWVEELNEKEIHITNSSVKDGMVWYTYTWFTGNIVRSGEFTVEITVKDRLSGKILPVSRKFYLDLSRKNT